MPAQATGQPAFAWESSLNFSQKESSPDEEEDEAEELTPKAETSPPSVRAFPALTEQEESPPRLRSLGGQMTPPGGEAENSASLNPFDEEDSSTPTEEDPSNPFSTEIQQEHREVANGKKEYNPFEEEEDDGEEGSAGSTSGSGNPFEEDANNSPINPGNPFTEASGSSHGASTNPFEREDDEGGLPDVDMIEEELLLQQIDNIRAYIFDAKLNKRLDEVELLSENLRELQRTLQEQKKKTH